MAVGNGTNQLQSEHCCPFRLSVCQHRLTLFSSARLRLPLARARAGKQSGLTATGQGSPPGPITRPPTRAAPSRYAPGRPALASALLAAITVSRGPRAGLAATQARAGHAPQADAWIVAPTSHVCRSVGVEDLRKFYHERCGKTGD